MDVPAQSFGQGVQNPGKINKRLGADIHDPKARTSTTLRDFQKLRSEKLWAEFSLPRIFPLVTLGCKGDFRFSDVPKPEHYLHSYRDLHTREHCNMLSQLYDGADIFVHAICEHQVQVTRVQGTSDSPPNPYNSGKCQRGQNYYQEKFVKNKLQKQFIVLLLQNTLCLARKGLQKDYKIHCFKELFCNHFGQDGKRRININILVGLPLGGPEFSP